MGEFQQCCFLFCKEGEKQGKGPMEDSPPDRLPPAALAVPLPRQLQAPAGCAAPEEPALTERDGSGSRAPGKDY